MNTMQQSHVNVTRRNLLKALGALGITTGLPMSPALAAAGGDKRILVVVEMSGANDGLNTQVP